MADETPQGLTFNQYSVLASGLNDIKARIGETETRLLTRMDEQYARIEEQSRHHQTELDSHDDRLNSLERLRLWFFFGIVILLAVVVIALLVGFIVIQGMVIRGA